MKEEEEKKAKEEDFSSFFSLVVSPFVFSFASFFLCLLRFITLSGEMVLCSISVSN